MDVKAQVHGKFKVFTAPLEQDGSMGALAEEAARFVKEAGVAPKSIGVEFVEALGKLVLTIGYRDDEPGYEVKFSSVHLGQLDALETGDLNKLEVAMERASAKLGAIICHELYITAKQDFHMVFMTLA